MIEDFLSVKPLALVLCQYGGFYTEENWKELPHEPLIVNVILENSCVEGLWPVSQACRVEHACRKAWVFSGSEYKVKLYFASSIAFRGQVIHMTDRHPEMRESRLKNTFWSWFAKRDSSLLSDTHKNGQFCRKSYQWDWRKRYSLEKLLIYLGSNHKYKE